jgi:hypothetical protein
MGKKVNVKDLTDAKVQAEFTDDQAFKTINDGKKDKDDKILMKALEGATDADIKGPRRLLADFQEIIAVSQRPSWLAGLMRTLPASSLRGSVQESAKQTLMQGSIASAGRIRVCRSAIAGF